MNKACKLRYIIALCVALIVVMLISVSVGSVDISISESFKIIAGRIPLLKDVVELPAKATFETIIWQVRMPRIIMAALIGGALAVVGAVFQTIFGNPLADPHMLGVSSGAALGATIAMLTGLTLNIFGLGTIGCFAFAGALATVMFVYAVSRVCGVLTISNILLMGTAVSTMLSAIISLLMVFHHDQIEKVYMWIMGSVSSATWLKDGFVAVIVLVCLVIIFIHGRKLNLLMMGEEDAASLGLDTARVRRRLMIVCSVLVAATVSVGGIIGFVGLIIPHCVKLVAGVDSRKVLPYGFLTGAIFLVVCDTVARTIVAPTEIPVGVITAICGAPFFIGLIIRQKKYAER